jgi:hypothetical protein
VATKELSFFMKQFHIIICCAALFFSNTSASFDTLEIIGEDSVKLLDTANLKKNASYALHQRVSFENGSTFFKRASGGNSYALSYGLFGNHIPLGGELLFSRFSIASFNKSALYVDTATPLADTIPGVYSANLDLYFLGAFLGGSISYKALPLRFNPEIGFGFLSYSLYMVQRFSVFDYKSFMPCLSAGISIDYLLSSFFALRLGLRVFKAQTNTINFRNTTSDLLEPIVLDRLDTYLGISIYFHGHRQIRR